MKIVADRKAYSRLADKVRMDLETGCWNWHGYVHRTGYGQTMHKGRNKSAHRTMWLAVYGQIKGGLDVLHTCHNKRCCSPLHLRLGTHRENLLEASQQKALQGQWKTHCKRGHPLSGDNLMPKFPTKPWRQCKTCDQLRRMNIS